MTLTRNEIGAFIAAAILLHLGGFYWAFYGRPEAPGALATGSGGIMIDLAGQAGAGGAPKGNTLEPVAEPEPQPVEKTAPPEPKPEPKPDPVVKSVPKPEPLPEPVPKPVAKRAPQAESQKQVRTKPAPSKESAPNQGRPDGAAETAEGNDAGTPGLAAQGKAGSGESAGGGSPGARADYRSLIIGRLAREKRYPMRARMRGTEGTGLLRLVIAPDGSVVSSAVEKTTGSSLLDAEIERMVERAAPFPPFPENMGRRQLTMRIPVEFTIR